MCFPSPVCVDLSVFFRSFFFSFAPTDDANLVSESTEIVDVSPSITTNIIGQKADELGTDMCERSCEELSTMFQELKGLRVVVSNLMDGLQKVVSARRDQLTPSVFCSVNKYKSGLVFVLEKLLPA